MEQILDYSQWQLHKAEVVSNHTIENGKLHGSGIIAKLTGVDTRNTAEAIVGSEIWVLTAELPKLANGEYYWYQLLGLKVITTDGKTLGNVARLMETGANDVLVVTSETDASEILIPYIQNQVIKNIDLSGKLIIVDWQADFI